MFPSMSAFDPIKIRPQHFMLGEGDLVLSVVVVAGVVVVVVVVVGVVVVVEGVIGVDSAPVALVPYLSKTLSMS